MGVDDAKILGTLYSRTIAAARCSLSLHQRVNWGVFYPINTTSEQLGIFPLEYHSSYTPRIRYKRRLKYRWRVAVTRNFTVPPYRRMFCVPRWSPYDPPERKRGCISPKQHHIGKMMNDIFREPSIHSRGSTPTPTRDRWRLAVTRNSTVPLDRRMYCASRCSPFAAAERKRGWRLPIQHHVGEMMNDLSRDPFIHLSLIHI